MRDMSDDGRDRSPRAAGRAARRDVRVARFFFFQAEDGIRGWSVTGVQTCALPIFEQAAIAGALNPEILSDADRATQTAHYIARRLDAVSPTLERGWTGEPTADGGLEIGRASCRERV